MRDEVYFAAQRWRASGVPEPMRLADIVISRINRSKFGAACACLLGLVTHVAMAEYALPKACEVDKSLCARVKRYLQRYSRDYAVTHASTTGSITRKGEASDVVT